MAHRDSGVIFATATDGNDVNNGSIFSDWLLGLGGNDTPFAGDGAESLDGGSGDDWEVPGLGVDALIGWGWQ
ncbi:hypothetical protein [Antarctobacter sp.]|uniref:hypothetical protein n=1 Tax=Antarctobacter sp. TaxID=1872577 RepID=UPI002B277ADC|nr:hypothetical protein [Antarctobacter sp.]